MTGEPPQVAEPVPPGKPEHVVEFNNVTKTYHAGTPAAFTAIRTSSAFGSGSGRLLEVLGRQAHIELGVALEFDRGVEQVVVGDHARDEADSGRFVGVHVAPRQHELERVRRAANEAPS